MPPPTATGPNGEKVVLQDGQWVPLTPPAEPAAAAPPPKMPRIGALPGKPTEEAAAMDRMIRGGLKTAAGEFVANILGIPHAAGELLALGAAGLRTAGSAAAGALKGEPLNLGERFEAARQKEEGTSFASALLAAPEPTGDEVLEWVGAEPAEGIEASAGRTAADVATLMTLRPGQRVREILKRRRATPAADRRARLLAREGSSATAKAAAEADEAANTIMRSLGLGTGKAAEAGFEGAVVGALGDGDPAKTAAWTAGIQAGGSAALAAKGWIWKNPGKAAITLWLGHEMWKAALPGPQNALESKDEVIREMVGAYGLGAVASLAGASRPVKPFARALSNASRGAVASVVTQLQEATARGEPHYEQIVAKFAEDPDYFGREARSRLELAAFRERPNALLTEIDSLMKSRRFRSKVEGLQTAPPSSPVYHTGGGF